MFWDLYPPEVNSARMYSGPGATPLLTAASAWSTLAEELTSTAMTFGNTVSSLSTTAQWVGPSSTNMLTAGLMFSQWLNGTAAQAQQTASNALAAVAAFEEAFAMTVPPAVVAANRSLLAMLVATNFLGINTPAILETEAHYAEMWAQDVAAMNAYLASSSPTWQLTPYTPPPQSVSPGGMAAQSASVAQAAATPAGNAAATVGGLTGLETPTPLLTAMANPATPIGFLWNNFGPNATIYNTIFSSGFYMPSNWLFPLIALQQMQEQNKMMATANQLNAAQAAGVSDRATDASKGAGNAAVEAELGTGAKVTGLTVPTGWTQATGSSGGVQLTAATTPLSNGEAGGTPGMAGAPGMFGAPGGRSGYGQPPRYGRKLTVVPRSPSGG